MEDSERIKMLESYGTRGGAYCSYAMGHCAHGNNVQECAKRNPVECRNCRQKNEEAAR
jgi:hypothetical protein